MIGHEIAHSFDALTRKENEQSGGNSTWWWPSELDKEYELLTKCFVDQFSSYVVESTGEYVSRLSTSHFPFMQPGKRVIGVIETVQMHVAQPRLA